MDKPDEAAKQAVTVKWSTYEDARRIVLDCLNRVPQHLRGQTAKTIISRLRDARLLQQSVEQHYNAVDVARLLGRTPEWVAKLAKCGGFGVVSRDGGGWLIPASGVQAYLDTYAFSGSRPTDT